MKRQNGAMVQNGAKRGAMHSWCNGANPYIGIAPLLHLSPPDKCKCNQIAELVVLVLEDFRRKLERVRPNR